MGFTVAGPDRFLGCGHPDLRENLPALLGLMESTDRGQTWHSLSLLGEVDFHAIEAKHGQVYGYDATSETFLVSPDGRTWQRRAQVPLADYTVAPTRADLVLATGKAGLLRSTDEGRSFLSLPAHRGSTYWTGPTVACSGSQPTVRSGSAATPGTAGSGAVTSAANRKQSPWPAMAGSSPQASTTSPSPPTAAEASPQSSATRAVAPVTRGLETAGASSRASSGWRALVSWVGRKPCHVSLRRWNPVHRCSPPAPTDTSLAPPGRVERLPSECSSG